MATFWTKFGKIGPLFIPTSGHTTGDRTRGYSEGSIMKIVDTCFNVAQSSSEAASLISSIAIWKAILKIFLSIFSYLC